MIDPRYVTNYDRSDAELEEFWLFCIVVAGKTAMTQAKLLDAYLTTNAQDIPFADASPFEIVQNLIDEDDLLESLKLSRLGQYNRLKKAFEESMALKDKLRMCNVEDLEAITGVGSKTARFFLLHTRQNQDIAVLDTHVLKFLRDKGLTEQKVTPPAGKKYAELEKLFIAESKKANMSIADFDLHIWRTYSGNT